MYVLCARGVNALAQVLQSWHVDHRGGDSDEDAHQRAYHPDGTADFHLQKL